MREILARESTIDKSQIAKFPKEFMYVILIHYTKPIEEVDRQSAAHRSYLDKAYADGTMIVSGRRMDQKGGVLLANMASRAEVDNLIAGDPYKTAGVADYEVIDFHPGKYAQDFGSFIHAAPRVNDIRPEVGVPGDLKGGAR